MDNKKTLLFSVTKKDFVVQTFRSGGKGGQHQNTTDSGVRIIHPDSGAVGESREERSQHQNKKIALQRLAESAKFKVWHARKVNELLGHPSIEEIVDKDMEPKNLKIEIKKDGKWVLESENDEE
jgi:peptide chain release factor 1